MLQHGFFFIAYRCPSLFSQRLSIIPSVEDTGAPNMNRVLGISEEDVEELFAPASSVDKSDLGVPSLGHEEDDDRYLESSAGHMPLSARYSDGAERNLLSPTGLARFPPNRDQVRILPEGDNDTLNSQIDRLIEVINPMALSSSHTVTTQALRLLSNDVNDTENERIDRLIAAIEEGHHLKMDPDPRTGNVVVSAVIGDKGSDSNDRLESRFAASPHNFGTITDPTLENGPLRRVPRMVRPRVLSGVRCGIDTGVGMGAAPKIYFALESLAQGDVETPMTPVRKTRRPQGKISKEQYNRRLVFMGPRAPEVDTLSPIPINFDRPPLLRTPSVKSTRTEVDCNSLLFQKSAQVWLQGKHPDLVVGVQSPRASEQSRVTDRVMDWLQSIEPSAPSEAGYDPEKLERAIEVFHDEPTHPVAQPQHDRLIPQTLRDGSNVQRPGYLQHNSFANVKPPIAESTAQYYPYPFPSNFRGATDLAARRSYTDTKWPTLLPHRIQSIATRSPVPPTAYIIPRLGTCQPAEPAQTQQTQAQAQRTLLSDPIRTASFDLALARLEGCAPGGQYSPLKRYADRRDDYGSSVELEAREWSVRAPLPLRLDGHMVLGQGDVGEQTQAEE